MAVPAEALDDAGQGRENVGADRNPGRAVTNCSDAESCCPGSRAYAPKATLVALITPNHGETFPLSFTDAEALRDCIAEMAPRSVTYLGVSSEDEQAAQAMLTDGSSEVLH